MTESNDELDVLVSVLIDGALSPAQVDRLQALLESSPAAVARYQELLDNHEALCTIYPGELYADSMDSPIESLDRKRSVWSDLSSGPRWWIAVSILGIVGLAGYFLGSDQRPTPVQSVVTAGRDVEQTLQGHATLRRGVDLTWARQGTAYREGDVITAGRLQFDAGVAEIDFFCGATLIVEGPAVLDVRSDWSVQLIEGRLRANVPPAARGFVVQAADSDIVDLGTEFAVEVTAANARVEVIDGEVKLQGGKHDGQHLLTGQGRWLDGTETAQTFVGLSTIDDLRRRRQEAEAERFDQWKSAAEKVRNDDRLIAHYPIAQSLKDRVVPNAAASGDIFDGILVGPVGTGEGRFGSGSKALTFDRTGARVRTRIDGDFDAFTFTTWVRIDKLDQVYNALFMSDGYETGEVHWQIRDDGRVMFSIMVDDTKLVEHFNDRDQRIVKDAGLHRVYMTPPIWDLSQSGQWFHLAAVYDPSSRRVIQYVNGTQVSSEVIADQFWIDTLRIGPAEIGNWGQPFRDTPWFAVRNFSGAIDELAIFGSVLSADEIQSLYTDGKPLGY